MSSSVPAEPSGTLSATTPARNPLFNPKLAEVSSDTVLGLHDRLDELMEEYRKVSSHPLVNASPLAPSPRQVLMREMALNRQAIVGLNLEHQEKLCDLIEHQHKLAKQLWGDSPVV